MTTVTIEVFTPPAQMPDADTDILVWEHGQAESQLGAYVGEDSATGWVDAQGAPIEVTRWAELPRLPRLPAVVAVREERVAA